MLAHISEQSHECTHCHNTVMHRQSLKRREFKTHNIRSSQIFINVNNVEHVQSPVMYATVTDNNSYADNETMWVK